MDLKRGLDPELQLEAEELEAGLKYVERIRPVAKIPAPEVILGRGMLCVTRYKTTIEIQDGI